MKQASRIIPKELHRFLAASKNRRISWDRELHPEMEVDWVEFRSPSDLKHTTFPVGTSEYHLNHDEPGEDPDLYYDIEGINLIQNCHGYQPDGILIYFPLFQEFGSWDCDHGIITLYPKVAWTVIERRLADYVNAQWYPHLVEQYLLRPWADDRCSDFQSRSSNDDLNVWNERLREYLHNLPDPEWASLASDKFVYGLLAAFDYFKVIDHETCDFTDPEENPTSEIIEEIVEFLTCFLSAESVHGYYDRHCKNVEMNPFAAQVWQYLLARRQLVGDDNDVHNLE
jgi:hypothetical protein